MARRNPQLPPYSLAPEGDPLHFCRAVMSACANLWAYLVTRTHEDKLIDPDWVEEVGEDAKEACYRAIEMRDRIAMRASPYAIPAGRTERAAQVIQGSILEGRHRMAIITELVRESVDDNGEIRLDLGTATRCRGLDWRVGSAIGATSQIVPTYWQDLFWTACAAQTYWWLRDNVVDNEWFTNLGRFALSAFEDHLRETTDLEDDLEGAPDLEATWSLALETSWFGGMFAYPGLVEEVEIGEPLETALGDDRMRELTRLSLESCEFALNRYLLTGSPDLVSWRNRVRRVR